MSRSCSGRKWISSLCAFGVLFSGGVVLADTWDAPVAAPKVNNSITQDGSLGDWGTAGTNYIAFGAWNQWYDGSYNDGYQTGHTNTGTTTSRMALDTTNNRLLIGVQTTQQTIYGYELMGLFGGPSLDGQRTSRAGVVSGSDGTQLHFFDSGMPAVGTNQTIAIAAYDAMRNGASLGGASGNATGATGKYTYDGTTLSFELSIPIKKDWTSADATSANTWDLSTVASGTNQIAYNLSFFSPGTAGFGAYGQDSRFNDGTLDGYAGYGDGKSASPDFWQQRGVNVANFSAGTDQVNTNGGTSIGGLTLVGVVPEPASLGVLAVGSLTLLRRRKA